ncbi:MAG: SDR family NAD(P)-dependent oxidoreductase [Legionella sp.]|nr:MAG: SDR family NAD(P)-dependent oxidoreductase [Legionella sp.]
MKIDWEQLYAQKPQLISLPTYPFAKRRCWIPTKEVEVAPKPVVDAAPIAAIPSFNADEWLYAMEWEKQGLSQSTVPQLSEGPWLIISDKEFGLVVQDQLGAESSICFAAADYLQFNDQVFYANLNRQADYEKVLAAQGKNLQGIIYLSSAVNPEQQDPTESLLALFKAMIIHCLHKPLRFALVTHSAQAVQATDNINYWQHHLWSMTRIFAAEQAHCQAVLLDLDAKASHQLNAQQVVAELSQIQATQNHLAYRRNERYSIRFKTAQATTTTPWKAPVAALITGGLGALGYEVAEYLLAQGTQYLLLTGTSALTADTKEKNTWLQQLQRKKVQVIYAAVDVADKAAMQKVIQDTEKTWQKSIDGVFHLAGITTDNITIADMDEALWRKVLDVKVKGSLVLHELFLKQTLTSFVLFSSIACVPHFGMSGLSAYAVANEFMSGLALYRRSQQLPAVSMNWVAWSEKGMSHRHNHDAFLDAVGMASLTIKEGIQVMDRVLQLNPAEITLCKLYWQKFLQINASAKQLDFFSHFTAQYGQQKAVISQVAAEDIAPLVLKLFAKSLQLQDDEVDEDTPFQQYGMDSIVGIHFTADLDKHFPDAVSPMDLYRYPSLKQLSDYIRQQVQTQPAQAAELSEENVQIDTLSYDQLNELIEAELKELELTYE